MRKFVGGAALSVLAFAMASAAYAQETTGAMRGQVTDGSGAPAAGAAVTIVHVPTGTSVSTVTNADGNYTVRGLRVGGPYKVSATFNGKTETSTVQQVGIGTPVPVDVAFVDEVAEVVVTGTVALRENNGGPSTGYGLADIQELPSLKRDLKDVARLNPFVTLDPSNLDAVTVAGTNSKYNSLTVDGVKQNDDFGLNNNGYPTQRSPISTDAVQAVSVNIAPYSVLYNDFQGANINVVTKSGTNELHGSAFYERSDEDMIGTKAKTQTFTNSFKEEAYGVTLGGPIWQDRIFFFGSYEKFKADRATIAGPVGSGKPVITGNPTAPTPFVTAADVTRVQNALATRYGYTIDRDNSILNDLMLPEVDEKWLGKIDWNITDNHRLALTYQDTSGTKLIEGNRSSATQLALYSDYYIKGDALKVYTAQLNSDWTENLRTELVATKKNVVTIQQPVGGESGNGTGAGDEEIEIGQFSIGANPAVAGTGTRILAGPDVSRHANELKNKVTNFRGRVFYDLGDNDFVAGVEREKLDVFNLFAQRTEGEFTFNSIALFEAGTINQLSYQNAIVDANGDGVRNEEDLAAAFDFTIWNWYAQDTLRITQDLSVTAGFRYTRYVQSDRPLNNAFFVSRYGFSNNENLNGRDVVMPRVSIDYRPSWEGYNFSNIRISGGAGLFSGGSSTVWVSNSFSNTGVLGAQVSCQAGATSTACGAAAGTTDNVILAQLTDYKNIPAAVEALLDPTKPAIQNLQRAANVNAIDPAFEPIQTWKSNLSIQADLDLWKLGSDYRLTFDFLRTDVREAILWKDYRAGLQPTGRAPDGRPIYRTRAQRGQFLTGVAGQLDAGTDLVLTNTDEGFSQSFAIALAKDFDWGIDASASYTYVDAKEVNAATSSTASSNFGQTATADINNPGLATSNYEIKHSFKGRIGWKHEFFGDYATTVNMFIEHRSGYPFSYVYNASATTALDTWGDPSASRQLLYVPNVDASGNVTATSDPIVTYATGATAVDIAAFNQYLKDTGLIKYAGQISPRNAFRNPKVTRVDLAFNQEFPAFFPNGAKLTGYVVLANVGNMLNKNWGVIEQVDFPSTAPIISTAIVNGRYQYSSFTKAVKPLQNSDAPNRSLWQVKVGLKYNF